MRVPSWLTSLVAQLIKAGEGIIASNQSANRDEDIFENPDKFDIHRNWPKEDPLGYGYGDHRCIAEHLAKAELTSVFGKFKAISYRREESADQLPLEHLFKKLPNLKLATPIDQVEYSPLHRDVGILKLPVTF